MPTPIRALFHLLQALFLLVAAAGALLMVISAIFGDQLELAADEVLMMNAMIIFAILAVAASPALWSLRRVQKGAPATALSPPAAPVAAHTAPATPSTYGTYGTYGTAAPPEPAPSPGQQHQVPPPGFGQPPDTLPGQQQSPPPQYGTYHSSSQ